MTCGQSRAHFLRHKNDRPQARQSFSGNCDLWCVNLVNLYGPVIIISAVEGAGGRRACPVVTIGALRIPDLGLFVEIKMAATAGICANASYVLPVTPVAAGVIIEQLLRKIAGAAAPVQAKLIDQAAGGNLSPAVAEQAGLLELVHAGINDRPWRFAIAPLAEAFWIETGQGAPTSDPAEFEQGRLMVAGMPAKKFSPHEFEEDPAR